MKTLVRLSPTAAPLAVAVWLLFFAGNLRASGPGGTGNSGGANGAGITGTATTGGTTSGGSRGGSSTGGNVGTSSVAPAISVARSGVSFSSSSTRMSNGLSTQNAGIRGNAPSALSLPYRNVQNGPSYLGEARPATSHLVSRPNNAWSGTAVNVTGTGSTRSSSRSLYNSNGYTTNRFAGQVLYPGASGSNLPTTNNWTYRGNAGDGYRSSRPFFRSSGRYSYYPYAYGPAYAPYISYYGGGYPPYAAAYPYYNDVPTADADFGAGNSPGTGIVSPQYADQDRDANGSAQPDPARQQQASPAPQSRNGNTAAQGTIPGNGPDSLVEAVQQELIRRGYFGGKVDAMFNPETKEALRKFQADHHLAESGLINEATLHALQLD